MRLLGEFISSTFLSCAIMYTFGSLKAELNRKETGVDDFDLLIAATAMTMGYCVVSNNVKHFSKIPGMQFENWTKI